MSKCDVRIELDRNSQIYSLGDKLNCEVHVSVDKPVECNKLVLRRSWYTHGRGNVDSQDLQVITLFKGEWQPGEYRYPVAFDIDSGPLTYRGHNINVDWQLEVRADIPWSIDPRSSVDFIVERGDAELPTQLDEEDTAPGQNAIDMDKYRPYLLIVPLIFMSIGAGIGFFGWSDNDPFTLIFGSIFFLAGLIAGFFMIRNSLAQRKLGKVNVRITPNRLRPGEEAVVYLDFTPRSPIDLKHITAKLYAAEKAVSGSGTNRTTHTHTLYSETYELSGPMTLAEGMPVQRKFRFTIPPEGPCTFIAADNRIEWKLEIHIDIDNWPDWVKDETIPVVL
ncbi:MAG: SoxR reducing system RseC family protein [Gammaproteobacteria bacterium]|nr:SoxR reducing system RseC family protein [Gammaproteobacteria bacterium]MDH5653916.1 SoxR reducing system RseC family protein [Gammaproteobacteria bacterium]